MRLNIKYLLLIVLPLLTLAGCSEKEDGGEEVHDDSYYASLASVSSDDTRFSITSNGGAITFAAEGGEVVVNVNCGTEWTDDNHASDLFTTVADTKAGTLTVSAGQNAVEEKLSTTVSLRTVTDGIEFATLTLRQSAYGAPEITVGTAQWHAPAVGDLSVEIEVDSSLGNYEIENDSSWLSAEKTENGITLTAEENDGVETRSAEIVLACDDGIKSDSAIIEVTQDARAYITSERESLKLYESGESSSFKVESNYDWDWTCSGESWYSVTRSGDALTVTLAEDNDGTDREGTLTITAGDGAENLVEATIPITQPGPQPDDLVLEYTITERNTETRLPLYGTVNCTVYWGDGSEEESVMRAQPSHTYAEAGIYNVRVSGKVTALNSYDISSDDDPLPLTGVIQWGSTGLEKMDYAFYYCRGFNFIPEETGSSLAAVTSFHCAFFDCEELASVPSDLFAQSREATSFAYVFCDCLVLESIPEGLFDNCSEVTSFAYSFCYCKSLASVPADLFAKCPKVTTFEFAFRYTALTEIPEELFSCNTEVTSFEGVFYYCTALKSIPSGLFANCSKVTDFSYAFYSSSITSIPEDLFVNCPVVTTFASTFGACRMISTVPAGLFAGCPDATVFSELFASCIGLKTIPSGLFDKNTKATALDLMFYFCSSLTTIPDHLFDNCTEVTDIRGMFYQCKVLETIPEGLFDSFSKVTNMSLVFYHCSTLTSIPEGLFANCPDVTSFMFCFNDCRALTAIPAGLFDNCMKVTDFSYAFYNCNSLTGESPYTELNGEKIHLYERAAHTADLGCVEPTDYTSCFWLCSSLTDLDDIKEAGWY